MFPTPSPSTDSPVEREWQLQERALGEERQSSGTAGAGARLLRYRLVCRQLLRPVGEQDLSMSPAASARQIEAVVAAKARAATRFEKLLVAAFLMVAGAGAAGAGAYAGGDWQLALGTVVAAASNRWLVALAGCAVLSILIAGATHAPRESRSNSTQ